MLYWKNDDEIALKINPNYGRLEYVCEPFQPRFELSMQEDPVTTYANQFKAGSQMQQAILSKQIIIPKFNLHTYMNLRG